jgi:Helix-turn-helix domain of resolvase
VLQIHHLGNIPHPAAGCRPVMRFGRPLKMTDHQRREALHRMDAGESVVELARTFGVDRATLYRMQALACAPKG